ALGGSPRRRNRRPGGNDHSPHFQSPGHSAVPVWPGPSPTLGLGHPNSGHRPAFTVRGGQDLASAGAHRGRVPVVFVLLVQAPARLGVGRTRALVTSCFFPHHILWGLVS